MLHAEVLRGALRAPVQVGGLAVALDASAGLSVHPARRGRRPAMLRHADVAL